MPSCCRPPAAPGRPHGAGRPPQESRGPSRLIESGEGAGDPAGAQAAKKGSAHPTRRRLLIGVGAALLLVGAGAGTAAAAGVLPGQARKNEDKPAEFTGTTEEITRGTLQGETSAAGTLRFSDSHVLRSGFEGVVTWLPAAGTMLCR